jgi:Tfp pilus assembly protein PilF
MSRLAVVALVSLLVTAGCANLANRAGEDLGRLEEINSRFNTGDFEHALTETTKFVQQYPRSYKGWSLLGWIYLKMDAPDKARESFDKALSINPRWDNAHVGKGAVYRKLGDTINARKSYLEAISIAPDEAEAYASLLVIELMEGNNEKAVEYGEKAWALRKDYAVIPSNLAVAYHYLGDYSKRDRYYREAERLGYYNMQKLRDLFDGKVSIR